MKGERARLGDRVGHVGKKPDFGTQLDLNLLRHWENSNGQQIVCVGENTWNTVVIIEVSLKNNESNAHVTI